MGEFCFFGVKEHVRRKVDGIIASPYGLSKKQKDADHFQARKIESDLLLSLCNSLNLYHGTQYDSRFWQIVLGHWLRSYVDVILNRIKTLQKCFEDNEISSTTVFRDDHYFLGAQDSYSAIFAFNDDRWNLALTAKLLTKLNISDLTIDAIKDSQSAVSFFNYPANSEGLLKKTIRLARQTFLSLLSLFSKDSDAFILNSYLSRKKELKLQFLLGQLPQIWSSRRFDFSCQYDRELRERLTFTIAHKTDDFIRDIAFDLAFELMPMSFLEDFVHFNSFVRGLRLPKRPKFIFTSNNFDTDEVFKLWVAKQSGRGVRYIVGQHGNNYGTHRYMCPSVEEITPDKFLTWGWKDVLAQHTPAFVLLKNNSKRLFAKKMADFY